MGNLYVKNNAIPIPMFLRAVFIIDLAVYVLYAATFFSLGYEAVIGRAEAKSFFSQQGLEFFLIIVLVCLGGLGNMGLMCGFPRSLILGYINFIGSVIYIVCFFDVNQSVIWKNMPGILPFLDVFLEQTPLKLGLMRGGFCTLYLVGLIQIRVGYSMNKKSQSEIQNEERENETMGGMGTIGKNYFLKNNANTLADRQVYQEEKPKKSHWILKSFLALIFFNSLAVAGLYYLLPNEWKQLVQAVEKIKKAVTYEVKKQWKEAQQQKQSEQNSQPDNIINPTQTPNTPTQNQPTGKLPVMLLQEENDSKVITYRVYLQNPVTLNYSNKTVQLPTVVDNICKQAGIPFLINPLIVTDAPISMVLEGNVTAASLLNTILGSKELQYVICPKGLYITSRQRLNHNWKNLEVKK